jgi:hypothetical protein
MIRLPWRARPGLACVLVLTLTLALTTSVAEAVTDPAASSSTMVATYRGDAGRTGRMPGPAPTSTPAVTWQFQAA